MEGKVVHVKGVSFIGKANSNHWVMMDGPLVFQGSNAASRPMELVLLGLGGCTASDVASILAKMREPLQRFEIDLKADNAQEHPRVFTQPGMMSFGQILLRFYVPQLILQNRLGDPACLFNF